MIALVRSMMEWLGGTVSKDEGAEGGERSHGGKRKRGDEDDEVGTLSLKFRYA
jgi:cleavage and polyadenylation specificity factor subunit 2